MKLSDFIQQHSIDSVFKNGESWVILSEIEQDIKRKVEEFGVPLRDWNVSISYGIKTGCNEAFVIDKRKRQEILDSCSDLEERERTDAIIRPILRGRDIKKGSYEWAGLYCILAYYGFHNYIKAYPAVFDYLKQFEVPLKKRGQVRYTSSGKPKIGAKYPGQHHWLELDNNPRKEYMDDFDRQKILYSEIVRSPQFFLDDEKFVPEATSFVLSGEHLEYLVEYLNSPIVAWIFKTFYAGGGLGESGFRYKKKFLVNLPIPRSFDVDITESSITESSIAESYHLTDAEISFISSSLNSKAE